MLFWRFSESSAASARIVLLLDFALRAPSSTQFVDGNCSWCKMVTFHVRWWRSNCMHVRLVVVADTSRLGRN